MSDAQQGNGTRAPAAPHTHTRTFQNASPESLSKPYPTTRTPWSSMSPHVPDMTPDAYSWKSRWSASMAIDTGCCATAARSEASEYGVTSVTLATLEPGTILHASALHLPWVGTYG